MATKNEVEESSKATTKPREIKVELLEDGIRLLANNNAMDFTLDRLRPEIIRQLTIHGLKQKLIDAAALPKGSTIQDKGEAIDKVWRNLLDGIWSLKGLGLGNEGGLLLQALCELYPRKSKDDLKAWLDGKDKAAQAALRAKPEIAAVIAKLRKPSGVDVDDLLDELNN